jgi:hypothetical protein
MATRRLLSAAVVAAVAACGGVSHRVEIVDRGYIPQLVPGTLPTRAWIDDDGELRLRVDLAHACAEHGVALQRDTYTWTESQPGYVDRNEVETDDTVVDNPEDDRSGVPCIPEMVKDLATLQARTPWGAKIIGKLDGSGEAAFAIDWSTAADFAKSWWFEVPGARRVIATWVPSQIDRELAQDWRSARAPAPLVEPLVASVVGDELAVEVKNRGPVPARLVPLDVTIGSVVVQVAVSDLRPGQTQVVRGFAPRLAPTVSLASVAQPNRPALAMLVVPCGAQFAAADTVAAHDAVDQLAFRARVDAEAVDRAKQRLDRCW